MTDKLIALVSEFIKADDNLLNANKAFKSCGKPFTRHSSTYVCGKNKGWHGYCDPCQTALMADRIAKQSIRKSGVAEKTKALKELKKYWKEEYGERKQRN